MSQFKNIVFITNTMEQSPSWELVIPQLVKKLPDLYRTQRLINVFIRACLILSQFIQSTFPHTFVKITSVLQNGVIPSGILTKILYDFFYFSFRSFLRYLVHSKELSQVRGTFVTFRNTLRRCQSPCAASELKDHSLSLERDCLFNIPYLVNTPCRGDKGPT
jgi:hypothetical protein